MKAVHKTTKPIGRGKSKTQEAPPTHKAVTPKPHEKKTERKQVEEKRTIANKELLLQNEEKENRAAELILANQELAFQNEEKEKRAAELILANQELAFQNEEKEKRAAELILANKELAFQNEEKEKRAAELVIANQELAFQNEEKEKRAAELSGAVETLKRIEELLRQTGKMAKVGGWELDVQTMTLTWSLETYRIHEVDPSLKPDLENAINFYAPEARPTISEALQRAMNDGAAFDLELPFITATGKPIWVHSMGQSEFRDGMCVRLFGTFQDITERKRAETALHSAEENYRSIFEQAPVGIFQSTPQGRFRNVNSAMAQIYGYDSPKEMITEITSIGEQIYVNSSARQEFQRVLAERGEIHNSLDENYRKDGSRIWTQTTARAIKDKDGNILFYEGFIIDVTERLQEQLQLHESEERFRALIENASDMILTITADGNLNYVCPAALRITGYQANEVIGRNILEFIHADDLPLALQALASRSKISGLAPDPIELRFHHKDGVWRIVEILGNNLLEHPAVKGIVLNVRDITDHKQAEAAMRESEDRYRDLVENSQDLICTHDLDGQILSANPRAEKMLGYEHTALLQMNFRDILAPEVRPGLTAYLRRITKRGADQGQMIVQTKTGERRIWEYNNTLRTEGVSTPIVRGMARDITERKRAEEALRHSRDLLNLSGQIAKVGGWELDLETQTLSWTEEVYRIHEVDPSIPLNVAEAINFYAPESQPVISAAVQAGIDSGTPWDFELQLITAKGRRIWVRAQGVAERRDGKTVRLYGAFQDITERKQAEEALQQAEIQYRALVEQNPAVIYTVDTRQPDFFVYISQQIEALSGYSPQAFIADAQLWNNLIHTEDRERVLAEETRTNKTGESFNIEYRLVHRDGHLVWVHEEARQLHDASGQPTVWQGFMLDITERKLAEEVVKNSEKRFRALIENGRDNISLLAADGTLLWESPSTGSVLGYAPNQFVGSNIFDLVHPDDQGWTRDLYAQAVQTPGNAQEGAFRLLHADGTWRWIECSAANLLHEPSVQAIVINYRDITGRKRTEEALKKSENEYRLLFDNANDVIVIFEPQDEIILEANAAACAAYGYAHDELVGMSLKQFSRNVGNGEDHVREFLAGKPLTNFESVHFNKDGVDRHFLINCALIEYQDRKAILSINRDITERRQAEEEIKSQLEELQRWQDVMLGRGDREQKLKREVNELCRRVGESARYPSQEIGPADSETALAKS